MSRTRVIFVAIGVAVAILVVLVLLTPVPPPPAPPAPPPAARPKPPLQADAEGTYLPGYRFTVNRFQFTGFILHPDALVNFVRATGGSEQPVPCLEARISASTIHLRCDDPQIGTVTIDGRFLTRLATTRLDAGVVSAVVTVRSGSGEVLYRAQDTFQWHPGDEGGASP